MGPGARTQLVSEAWYVAGSLRSWIGRRRRMNPIAVNTVVIREDPSQYLIRYGIEKYRFAQVLSSVTSRSVLLFGVPRDETRKRAGTAPPCCIIAVIPLTASVGPAHAAADFEDTYRLLRL